ncbi:hypothetical protein F2Q69_00054636 [Brassica cretica]|uniref:Uncharacterized protein n=1 Tax=Brassica cretica TaxID=69181 RepID=A0A8S9MQI3_BRACR|nr:hypothetical protein F2Q69_00054636 [Brassica cretica]
MVILILYPRRFQSLPLEKVLAKYSEGIEFFEFCITAFRGARRVKLWCRCHGEEKKATAMKQSFTAGVSFTAAVGS